MPTFQANEFSASLPEGLKDKTVNIFSLTDEGPSDLGVVVARERPAQGEQLDGYVERQLKLLQERLPLFRIMAKVAIELDRQPAVQVDYTWQSGETQMFQRQVTVYAAKAGVMLIVSATCKGFLDLKWEAMFGELLADFHLRA
jgi:hypothetical protein